jgi:hypothetical protein
MLPACAASRTDAPRTPPAPVVERQVEVRLYCPPEIEADVAARPAVPDDALIEGNASGMTWLGDVLAWASSLWDRLADAQEACR